MNFLTRRGARAVTTDLDRIANLFQKRHADLGVPEEYAVKFAYYCDVLSDTVEKYAIKMAEDAEKAEGEDKPEDEKKEAAAKRAEEEPAKDEKPAEDEKKEASKKASARRRAEDEKKEEPAKDEDAKKEAAKRATQSKKSDDETGLSVDHGASGFDANVIADEVSGPKEIITPPAEPWMNDYFMQNWFQELRELQEAGSMASAAARGQILTKSAAASIARLRRLASVSKLSDVAVALEALATKLASADKKALAADVKKQADAVARVRAAAEVGSVEPALVTAADRIVQAFAEQLPYLQQVVAGSDSPEFQRLASSVVSLGSSIVVDAAKVAGEVPEAFKKNWDKGDDEKKDEAKDEKSEDEKKEAAAKRAEDEKDEDEKDDEGEDKEESDEDSDKTASDTFGYDLFAN